MGKPELELVTTQNTEPSPDVVMDVTQIDFQNIREPLDTGSSPANDQRPSKIVKESQVTVVTDQMKMDLVMDKERTSADEIKPQKEKNTMAEVKDQKKPAQIQDKESIKHTPSELKQLYRRERCLAVLTLFTNLALLVLKSVAVVYSGSLSIISSLVDSAVDITAGLVIWITTIIVKKQDPYWYPRGRTRLEPLALIIISIIRAVASTQVIIQAGETIIDGHIKPDIKMVSICIMVATIVAKAILGIICFLNKDLPSILFMGQDNLNDCLANSVAIVCGYIGTKHWKYMDPIGAILVSLYIAITWCIFGYTHAVMLSGRRAEAEYINGIIKLVCEHDERIVSLDTVFVYHWSTKFFVEIHLVFPKDMTVKTAHNIAAPLQEKIENLPYVERAFIHIDYQTQKKRDKSKKSRTKQNIKDIKAV